MTSQLVLANEINNAVGNRIDPVTLIHLYLPRLMAMISSITTVEDANQLRANIQTVDTYIKRTLPAIIKQRQQRFEHLHKAGIAWVEASAKAGAFWELFEEKKKPGGNGSNQYYVRFFHDRYSSLKSVYDVGFNSGEDAKRCVRASQVDYQERHEYYEICRQNSKEPTLNGIQDIWYEIVKKRSGVATSDTLDALSEESELPLTPEEIALAISTITANPADQIVAKAVRSILRIERKQAG